MATEPFLINPVSRSPKTNSLKTKKKIKSKPRQNSELLMIGGNPVINDTKKKPDRPKKVISISSAGKNKAKTKKVYRNPPIEKVIKKSKRRYRRNPVLSMPSLQKPQTLFGPLLLGIISNLAVDNVPSMLKLSDNSLLLGQAGVVIGGTIVSKKLFGDIGALVWLVAGGSTIVSGMVKKALLKGISFGDYPVTNDIPYPAENLLPDNYGNSDYPLDAFVDENMSAFPYESMRPY